MDQQHKEVRQRWHDELDALLDLVDAGGMTIDDAMLQVSAHDVEGNVESHSTFTADFASGQLNERYVEHTVYINNVPQGPTKRRPL